MIKEFTLIREDDGDYSIEGHPNTRKMSVMNRSMGYGVCKGAVLDHFPYLQAPDECFAGARRIKVLVADDDEDLDFALECYLMRESHINVTPDYHIEVDGEVYYMFEDAGRLLDEFADGSPFYIYMEPLL